MQTVPIVFILADDGLLRIAESCPAYAVSDVSARAIRVQLSRDVAGDVNIRTLGIAQLMGPFTTAKRGARRADQEARPNR